MSGGPVNHPAYLRRGPRFLSRAALLALACTLALPTGCGPKRTDDPVERDDDEGDKPKKKKKKKPALSPVKAYEARWLDPVTRKRCAGGPMLMDRTLELAVVSKDSGGSLSEVAVSFELCGPADPEAGDRLRMVWNKGAMAMVETTCDPPRTPGGPHPRNPRLVRCSAPGIPLETSGSYGLDIYLGDELLLDALFPVKVSGGAVTIDSTPRRAEAWLGNTTGKDGRPNRMLLELPIPEEARISVIYAWYRGEENIFKAREVEPDEFRGRMAVMVGPRVRDVLGRDGDYRVTVSIDAAPAWTIDFRVADGRVLPHPRQDAEASNRIHDRFMLLEPVFLDHRIVTRPEPATVERYGVWGKLSD